MKIKLYDSGTLTKKQRLARYALYFVFTVLVSWRIEPYINQITPMFHYLGLGVLFPILVCALSFALLNKDVYPLCPLRLGVSVIAVTGIYAGASYLSFLLRYRISQFMYENYYGEVVKDLAVYFISETIFYLVLTGLLIFLFYALVRFSAKEPVITSFPCKKRYVTLLLLFAAAVKIFENLCISEHLFKTYTNIILPSRLYRFQGLSMLLLSAVMIASVFIVAISADIQIRKRTE